VITLLLAGALLGGGAVPPAPIPPESASLSGPPAAAQALPLSIAADENNGFRPRLLVGSILDDPVLEEAVRSGVPLRIRLRTELWRDGFFNSLEGNLGMTLTVFYQPLEDRFVVRTTRPDRTEVRGFNSFAAVRAALEGVYSPELRPHRQGRYYYTALLELETLTLSDLAELERWLKGELQPAVSGDGSVPGAVGQGVKRLLVRVLRLPARRFEARSGWFRMP
jgi:hypothetical protein